MVTYSPETVQYGATYNTAPVETVTYGTAQVETIYGGQETLTYAAPVGQQTITYAPGQETMYTAPAGETILYSGGGGYAATQTYAASQTYAAPPTMVVQQPAELSAQPAPQLDA